MTSSVLALIADHAVAGEAEQRDGIALVSPTGQVNLANAAFWALLGRTRQRAALDHFIQAEDRNGFLTVMSDLAQGGTGPVQLMLRFARPDGSVVRVETLVSLVRVNGVLEQFIVQLTPARIRRRRGPNDQQLSQVLPLRPVSFTPDS